MPVSLIIFMFVIAVVICLPSFYRAGWRRGGRKDRGKALSPENVLYALRGITAAAGLLGSLAFLVTRQVAGPSALPTQMLAALGVLCFLSALGFSAGSVRTKWRSRARPAARAR